MTIPAFRKTILSWYALHRRDMPWRRTRDPYKILVSEIMLQQTQVSRVLPKYREFLRAFPAVKALADTDDASLLKTWKGLGYWRRAKFLKDAAKVILAEHNGKFPKDVLSLQKLPGIGPYTARAVACFAFQSPEAFIDTNIRRVYLHFFFPDSNHISDNQIMEIARKAVWKENPREWHYALFDYGAVELKDKTTNKKSKHYRKQSAFKDSFRSFRAKTMRFLLEQEKHQASATKLRSFLREEIGNLEHDPDEILKALAKDGLITRTKTVYHIQSRK